MNAMQQKFANRQNNNQAADIDEYFDFKEHQLDPQHKINSQKEKITYK